MGETKKLAMNLAEAEAAEKTGKEPERNPNHEEMELIMMPPKIVIPADENKQCSHSQKFLYTGYDVCCSGGKIFKFGR